jgi:RNA polymerase sigma-70 factor, ECF subfamily
LGFGAFTLIDELNREGLARQLMEVWQAIRKNPETGAKQLVTEYGNRLFAAAILLCPNNADAEELVFRSFDQAIKKIRQYEPEADFFSWLYTILLNFYRMDLRKKHVEVVPMGGPGELPEVPVEDVARVIESAADLAVRKAVQRLSEPLQEVVVLRYFQGLSLEEISQVLKISEGTVKSRLFNARAALYSILSKQEGVRFK